MFGVLEYIAKSPITSVSLAIGAISTIFIAYKTFNIKRTKLTDASTLPNSVDSFKIPPDLAKNLDPYDMKDYWYPVSLAKLITGEKPVGIKLLGEPLVLYRDVNGKIVCAEDICSHRMAKLSIGSMIDGQLECIYHGWRYGEDGQCKKIPSISTDSQLEKSICLKTKPCVEDIGLVWIWMGSPLLADESIIPRFIFQERGWDGWNFFEDQVDLDFPHDLMVDNLLDMAHVDFTHDGTIGARHKASQVQYTEQTDSYSETYPLAFSFDAQKLNSKYSTPNNSVFSFIPPCFIKLSIEIREGVYLHQCHAMIPLEKNKMRLLYSFHQTMIPAFITEYILPTSLVQYFSLKWSRKIIMQDAELLLSIMENLKHGSKYYSKLVNADAAIKKYRETFFQKALIDRNPWWKGYNTKDIEDLIK